MRIAEDGELLLRVRCLFSYYLRRSAGDRRSAARRLAAHRRHRPQRQRGFLYITGRKKELIVSSTGKKIHPSRVENLFKLEPLVNQILLVGDRLPYFTALFTVNTAGGRNLKGMEALKSRPVAELVKAEPVEEELRKAVKRVNKQLAPFEQIRRYRILERELSIENGELDRHDEDPPRSRCWRISRRILKNFTRVKEDRML